MSKHLPYTIRPMGPGDIPMVVAIDRLSFPSPWPASSYLHELRQKNKSFYYVLLRPAADEAALADQGWRSRLYGAIGLTKNSRVIGYVGLRERGQRPAMHISTIAIHPDWRRRGLGELVLLTALEKVPGLGFSRVSLEVRASNQVAQRLYRKYGFRFTGVHQAYYRDGEDAWLMEAEVDRDAYQTRLADLRRVLQARLFQQQESCVGQNDMDKL